MEKTSTPNDPSSLLRYRDSIYAADLLVCAIVYLNFFTFLKDGPWAFDEVCEKLKIEPRPADVLLSLLLSMGLIEMHQNRYRLTDLSMKYLVNDRPESLVPYYGSMKDRPQCVEFHSVLKTGKPAGWSSKKGGSDWIESMRNRQFADSFTSAMDSRGIFLAEKLAEKLDLDRYVSLLDIAGGSGIYACSIARVHGNIKATVFEIPPVDNAARESIENKGMSSRVNVVSGDMFKELPEGHDVHLFANVLHDWDYDSVKKLAANSFEILASNGCIAVFDAHLNDNKDGPITVAEYSCLLMHSTEGKCYSKKEICEVLQSVGFIQMEVIEIAADRSVIIGKKNVPGKV
ncbi:methyltransferase [Thermodesulfobacteriota bacterium]